MEIGGREKKKERKKRKHGRRRITHTVSQRHFIFDVWHFESIKFPRFARPRPCTVEDRGRERSQHGAARENDPPSSSLFIFFYFSPVPRLPASNELLSYSTVTAFFLANGFLHASPLPLSSSRFSPLRTSSSSFFSPPFPSFASSRFCSQTDFAIGHRTQASAQPSVQSQLCKRVFACVAWAQRKGVKKRREKERKMDTKLDCELRMRESLPEYRRNNRLYYFRDTRCRVASCRMY